MPTNIFTGPSKKRTPVDRETLEEIQAGPGARVARAWKRLQLKAAAKLSPEEQQELAKVQSAMLHRNVKQNPQVQKGWGGYMIYFQVLSSKHLGGVKGLAWVGTGFKDLSIVNAEPVSYETQAEAEKAIKSEVLKFIKQWRADQTHLVFGWGSRAPTPVKTGSGSQWTVYLFSNEGETLFEKTFPARSQQEAERIGLSLVRPNLRRFDNAEDWVVEPASP